MIFKKAQEEIVGFVAIVLVVVVIGVLFLGLTLQKAPDNQTKSTQIGSFLDSARLYTSNCALDYTPNYASLQDLLGDCYQKRGEQCLDGRDICTVLNQTVKDILDESWPVNQDSAKKGYEFSATFSQNATDSNGTDILTLAAGNCSSNNYQEGDSFFSLVGGVVTSTLRICY